MAERGRTRAPHHDPDHEASISDDRRTYTDQEFALILRRAAELGRAPDASAHPSAGLSLEEMKAIASEVGLDPALVERAARVVPLEGARSGLERALGGPIKTRIESFYPGAPTEERSARVLSAVRAVIEQQGEGQADASGMSWHSVGEGSQILVTAHEDGTRTRIRLVIDRRAGLALVATFTGLGTLAMAVATALGLEVLEVQSMVLGWSVLTGAVLTPLAIGRAIWASSGRALRDRLHALAEAVDRALAEPGRPSHEEARGAEDHDG